VPTAPDIAQVATSSRARASLSRATLVLHKDNATIFEEIVAGRADLMITDAIETRIMEREHP